MPFEPGYALGGCLIYNTRLNAFSLLEKCISGPECTFYFHNVILLSMPNTFNIHPLVLFAGGVSLNCQRKEYSYNHIFKEDKI